ncbi:MAG: ribbon-helix-helix protein, CopG family [Nitrososphaerota archaeon]
MLNKEVDEEVERVRRRLGMSRSEFIRYSVLRMLEELNVLSAKAHQENQLRGGIADGRH